MPLNAVGIISIVLGGMVTCVTALMSICSSGNVEIGLTCNGNGAGSDVTMDLGPWCRYNWLEKNQSIPKRKSGRSLSLE